MNVSLFSSMAERVLPVFGVQRDDARHLMAALVVIKK
jgi:hypothetical protein